MAGRRSMNAERTETRLPLSVEPATAPARAEPIGSSDAFQRLLGRIERYAPFDHIPVLFEGETGTGKTVLARYLHDHSARARKPFVPVDIAALDDDLAGSALFGHVRGAFTGAVEARSGFFSEAAGGTLFLDEIGKASLSVQRRLLSAVESEVVIPVGASRPVRHNIRLVAATNVPIDSLVNTGALLPDLAARLRACVIRLPALRERRDDIPHLVQHFIARFAPLTGYEQPPTVADRLMLALTRAPWRDNVRELDFAIQRLLIEAHPSPVLTLAHCDEDLAYLRPLGRRERIDATREQLEHLVRDHGSVREAALELGVSRATLYRRMLAQPTKDEPGTATPASQSEKPAD
jgi:DNA-binding NtrC family response regulator